MYKKLIPLFVLAFASFSYAEETEETTKEETTEETQEQVCADTSEKNVEECAECTGCEG